MNPLGLHAMVVTIGGDATATRHAAEVAARTGYDLLELPILDPASLDTTAVRAAATDLGLQLATSLGLTRDTDVSSQDLTAVRAGTQRLHQAVEVTAAAGADWLCGVLASALGRYPGPPTRQGWDNAVAVLREITDHAADVGINLGLEVVNRYESNLVTTIGTGLDFLDAVGSDHLWLHLDAYHALIEEDSLDGAVRQAGDRLGYVHVGQNDRGDLASGTVDLVGLLAALVDIGYQGPITFEAFSRATADPDLANILAIWRSPWTDGEALAADAIAFLRAHLPDRTDA